MSIDSCYEGVIAKLTTQGKIKQMSVELLSQETNSERVLFVYKTIKGLNAFPSVQEVKKNNDSSLYYRNQGNKCFDQTEYHKAWQYYNLSLLHAPINSENYCLALSNRSAVFYELNKYKECLRDIDTVFSLEYPKKLTEKLTKRKKMCNEALCSSKEKQTIKEDDFDEYLKMRSEKHSEYLCASNKLEVVISEEMGRHVIAKEDIKVGEVIVEEDPYFTLLLKDQYLFSCNYCLSRSLNLLPCAGCCYCLYCSDECKAKALKEYHSIECSLMATFVKMEFTKLELLALRTVLKARHDHNEWKDLFKTIKDAEENMNTAHHGHVKVGDKWIYDSKYYASIHTLATNLEIRSISDIFQKGVTAAVFLRFLENNSDFFKTENKDEYKEINECVAGLLLLHLMTSPTNMHGISSIAASKAGKCVDEISLASAPYAFCSLFNHSCAPNVVRFSKLGSAKMIVFALRPIKKGMQIFDNYGPHHALEERSSRQATLKFQFKFTCLCEACVNNWPNYMYLTMRQSNSVPAKLVRSKNSLLNEHVIDQLQRGNLDTALKTYKGICDLCKLLEPYAPCMELCDCQESLKQCLSIFEGLVPYGSSLMVKWKSVNSK
ncbi:SET and MYND domain-containing protein 4-like [Vanessa cardui]|uniref:SET and MYND domain-containing protein 4-like n=1 Tax=Vanessa cardui TaxID=171605 RepID=UPI001F138252|nr:SET and MYND domain-containing protein 4-like [Vanessa cardui]